MAHNRLDKLSENHLSVTKCDSDPHARSASPSIQRHRTKNPNSFENSLKDIKSFMQGSQFRKGLLSLYSSPLTLKQYDKALSAKFFVTVKEACTSIALLRPCHLSKRRYNFTSIETSISEQLEYTYFCFKVINVGLWEI